MIKCVNCVKVTTGVHTGTYDVILYGWIPTSDDTFTCRILGYLHTCVPGYVAAAKLVQRAHELHGHRILLCAHKNMRVSREKLYELIPDMNCTHVTDLNDTVLKISSPEVKDIPL